MAALHFGNMAAYKLHFVSTKKNVHYGHEICKRSHLEEVIRLSSSQTSASEPKVSIFFKMNILKASQPVSQQLDKHERDSVAATTGAADSLSSTAAHSWQPYFNEYCAAAKFTAKTRLWICHVVLMVQYSIKIGQQNPNPEKVKERSPSYWSYLALVL